ncbi:hypothetical protein [Polymorphospora rubra]|uniref:hypothetical protein n=1 Tax=Polymorphospora rubra TaxID=338584 RepID=UPI0033CC43F6
MDAINNAAVASDDQTPLSIRLVDDDGVLQGGLTGWTWGGVQDGSGARGDGLPQARFGDGAGIAVTAHSEFGVSTANSLWTGTATLPVTLE